MVYCIIICFCINATVDSIQHTSRVQKKSYTKPAIINSIIGISFGVGAGIFHTKGNQAYDNYCASTTMSDALENWETVKRYDVYRNVCIAGSAVFLIRACYYYLKNIRSSTANFSPIMEFDYVHTTMTLGIRKHL